MPSEDVNEWTVSLFSRDSVNRLSVFDRGHLMTPVWRLVEHAWLDLGELDQTKLSKLTNDLNNEETTEIAQSRLAKFIEILGLVRIDGVSEETDAEGTVTSVFEYFRQREEMMERGFGVTSPTEETPELTDTTKDLMKHWQCHWVLIKRVDLGTERRVTLSINKGCGSERNRAALGQFAEYVQRQWSAMHEKDTTCPCCGEQFLPSLIGEHVQECKGKSNQGSMLDYLKDDEQLYDRVKQGAYALRVEPKSTATGETHMGLVLIQEVTCNGCGLKFPANELEQHRRWDCTWTNVKSDPADPHPVLRRPGLLAPSQEFEHFKKAIKSQSML